MLEQAEEFIRSLDEPSDILWTTLLGACRSYNDIKRAERAAAEVNETNYNNINLLILYRLQK
jgi:hypothetical protein